MRTHLFIRSFFGIAIAGLAVAGCSVQETIVGKWETAIDKPGGGGVKITVAFNADGSETQTIMDGAHKAVITAKWKAINGQLTEQFLSATSDGQPDRSHHLTTQVTHYELDGNSLFVMQPGQAGHITYTRVFDQSSQ